MHEIEITDIPPLTPSENSLLEMHSILNILNVMRGEFALIGLALTGDDGLLSHGLAICDQLVQDLHDPAARITAAQVIDEQVRTMLDELAATLDQYPDRRGDSELLESLANLQSVFAVLIVRAREVLARAQQPDRWIEFSAARLQRDFVEVFAVMERNSRHRFRLLYNAARQQPSDYYIDLKIESTGGDRVWMPPVFQDVIRDLTANARKYTAPGGRITAAVHEDEQWLRLVVQDTGRGIPPDELTKVVEFGRRASNVGDVRTMGGGFGLTKAFLATKQFGGRFWIASALGVGTSIRIHLPRPADSVQAA